MDGVGVEVEDAVGINALDIRFPRARPGCPAPLAHFQQGTPLLVEQVDADATRAEAIAGQVPRLGRDEGRRSSEQALEQVLDAAVDEQRRGDTLGNTKCSRAGRSASGVRRHGPQSDRLLRSVRASRGARPRRCGAQSRWCSRRKLSPRTNRTSRAPNAQSKRITFASRGDRGRTPKTAAVLRPPRTLATGAWTRRSGRQSRAELAAAPVRRLAPRHKRCTPRH